MKRLILIFCILLPFSSCHQKNDFVFDDDEIRLIVNQRIVNYEWNFRKYTIEKRDYNRILISKNLLTGKSKRSVSAYVLNLEDDFYKITKVDDRLKYPDLEYFPYEEGDFFVYDIDELPPNLFFYINVSTQGEPVMRWDAGFEIEIQKSKIVNKKVS